MPQFEHLKLLQKQYPLTTAAAHKLVMRATELRLSRMHHTWIELNGSNKAQNAFENAVHDTLLWAAFETREDSAERLSEFTANFLAQFARACPSWENVLSEITDYLQDASTKNVSVLTDAIEQVQSDQSILIRHGASKSFYRFKADWY